jgi:phosphodiesterase/alkaline phosphatase D-like protein
MRSTTFVAGAAIVLALASAAGAGLTPEQKCQDAIAGAARKYFDGRYKALAKCQDAKAVSGTPADCFADGTVVAAIATAETKLSAKVTSKCPGLLIATADLGLACKGALTVQDVVDCVTDDVHGPGADRLIDTAYHDSGQITDSLLRTCQKTIGKAVRKGAGARLKARAKCAKAIALVDNPPTRCPDAKAFLALDKARVKLITLVEAKCNDTQVLDAALKFGGDCGDDRVGAPPALFQYLTFDRVPATNNNSIAPRTRLSRCLAAATAVPADTGAAAADALSDLNAFSYGVAAGDPTDTSFIAWTRAAVVSADLEVATNPGFAPVLQTIPGLIPNLVGDNTIKTEVTGLTASTQYYYRFVSGADTSRTGRIRTAPVPSSTSAANFVFTGDSNAFFKPFSVLEGITRDDPDLFLYIGDTIYSDDTRSGTGEAMVLSDYHLKYAENRDDSALRDLMASVGTATMWDDHEVTNDFYGSPFGAFGAQIVAGNQAYRDWMPNREDGGDPMKLYHSVKWGDLAEFFLIDCRQYRDPQAYVTEPACLSAGEPAVVPPAGACMSEINDPGRTYLGAAQKAWLKAGLAASTAKWKFIMNGPVLMNLAFLPYDRWEGYAAERTELLEFIRNPDGNTMTDDHLTNVVVLSTDIHAAIYNPAVTNLGPAGGSVPEIVAGAIGMDAIYRELPSAILGFVSSLPSLFPAIEFYDIDRRNYVHIAASTTQATFTYRDNTGSVLKTIVLTAE